MLPVVVGEGFTNVYTARRDDSYRENPKVQTIAPVNYSVLSFSVFERYSAVVKLRDRELFYSLNYLRWVDNVLEMIK